MCDENTEGYIVNIGGTNQTNITKITEKITEPKKRVSLEVRRKVKNK